MVVELWKSGDLKLCWKISLLKHTLIYTAIYLYYMLYVFITCLYVMFCQSSTLSLLWVYMCNSTIYVISVWPSRAHNWNTIYLIWFIWFYHNYHTYMYPGSRKWQPCNYPCYIDLHSESWYMMPGLVQLYFMMKTQRG